MRRYATTIAILATIMVMAVGGCTVSIGRTVDKDAVAKQVNKQLSEKVGQTPDDVSCPRDLDAKVSATLVCTLTNDGKSYDVTVTVTKVTDTGVEFDAKVANHPKP